MVLRNLYKLKKYLMIDPLGSNVPIEHQENERAGKYSLDT